MRLLARCEVNLHEVDEVQDVLLELTVMELPEDRDQTDDEMRPIDQKVFLLPSEVEDYCVIFQLI